MDPGGELRHSEILHEPPVRIDFEHIEAYLRRMGRLEIGPAHESAGIDYSRLARRYRNRFALEHPGPTEVRCQSKDVAWVRLFDPSADPIGKSRLWLRVSWHEDPLRFEFPRGFTPFLFLADGGYGVLEMVEGFQRLARWEWADTSDD
jgi:hypothetical protein